MVQDQIIMLNSCFIYFSLRKYMALLASSLSKSDPAELTLSLSLLMQVVLGNVTTRKFIMKLWHFLADLQFTWIHTEYTCQ